MSLSKTDLANQYQENKMRYERLCARVKEILQGLLKKDQIRTLPLSTRVKNLESFFDKIKRRNINNDYFNNIEDIAGVRVICIYFSDVEKIGKIIEDNFELVRADRKTAYDRVDVFGYLSDHYVVKLREESKLPSDEDLMDFKCEIQVRTILMHAWATVSHELDYKKERGISDVLKREMYAVSSLLYVADQRFDAYKKAEQEELKKAEELSIREEMNLDQPITSANLEMYLQWRFPGRKASETNSYEELVEQLSNMGFDSLQTIDRLIVKATNALLQYEKEHPPCSIAGAKYDRVGATRVCIALADTRNKDSKSFYVIDLNKFRAMIAE